MRNTEFQRYSGLDNWPRVELTNFPYLTLSDVERIYRAINNRSASGLEQFLQKAKKLATKVPSKKTEYTYQFMNETALFELFQEVLPSQLKTKGIDSWGRLMQFVS